LNHLYSFIPFAQELSCFSLKDIFVVIIYIWQKPSLDWRGREMNIGTMQFLSRTLGRHVTYEVALPEEGAGDGPFPVLFQLHGLSDDHSAYSRYSTLILKTRLLPLIVVMPSGGLAHWTDIGPRERYETFLVEDLWEHVHRTFPVRPGRAAIGGHSRGGNAAVRLALKHPDRFCSAVSHSGAFYAPAEVTDLGTPEERSAYDIWRVRPATGSTAQIHLDCGTEDLFIDHNRRFHQHLLEIGVAHTYEEFPGGHTWEYWNDRLDVSLQRHLQALSRG
jgi:putative tributyrin esterase